VPETNLKDNQRAMRAWAMFNEGHGYASIGKHFDVSRQAAMQMVLRGGSQAYRLLKPRPVDTLPTRVQNCLRNDSCPLDPVGCRQHYNSVNELLRIPGMGVKAVALIQEWLVENGQEPLPPYKGEW
jgi:hypothetical protein